MTKGAPPASGGGAMALSRGDADMKQFNIYIKDRVGELAKVTELMAQFAINIVAIASESGTKPVVRIVTADETSTLKALEKSGWEFTAQDILVLRLIDRPGELAKVSRKLAREAIFVQSIYIFNKGAGRTELALAVDNIEKARTVLNA